LKLKEKEEKRIGICHCVRFREGGEKLRNSIRGRRGKGGGEALLFFPRVPKKKGEKEKSNEVGVDRGTLKECSTLKGNKGNSRRRGKKGKRKVKKRKKSKLSPALRTLDREEEEGGGRWIATPSLHRKMEGKKETDLLGRKEEKAGGENTLSSIFKEVEGKTKEKRTCSV